MGACGNSKELWGINFPLCCKRQRGRAERYGVEIVISEERKRAQWTGLEVSQLLPRLCVRAHRRRGKVGER